MSWYCPLIKGTSTVFSRVMNRLWLIHRLLLLKLRGRVSHHDRYGLKYFLWGNTRAMATRRGDPRTDDTGVLEQLRRTYEIVQQPGRAVVSLDIGAYIGIISLAMDGFGPSNHTVHSFEADDLNYSRLNQNISGDVRDRVNIHNIAVGNEIGTAQFTRNLDPGTNHLGNFGVDTLPEDLRYEVPVTTLDAFADEEGFDEIDVMKIDVEGADMDVLRGAGDLLANGRIKVIIVEIPLTPEHRSKMVEFLTNQNLSVAYIVRNSAELTPVSEQHFSSGKKSPLNMIAVRNDVAERLTIPLAV